MDPTLQARYTRTVPHIHAGFSKNGEPIYIQKPGLINPEIQRFITLDEIMRCHIWDMEHMLARCREQSKVLGKPICTVVNILDLQQMGISIRSLLPMLNAIAALDDQHYPDMLGKTFVINAPSFLPTIWSTVKAFLPGAVAEKVDILWEDYQTTLLEYIDESQLLVEYGGSNPAVITVPNWDTIVEELQREEDAMGLTQETVAAGQESSVEVPVVKGQSVRLQWYFVTASYDISYRITFNPEEAGGPETVLVPQELVNSHQTCVKGSRLFEPPGNGKVVFLFDNTSSFWNAKQLKYKISAVPV